MKTKLRIIIVLTLLLCSVQLNAQTKKSETPYPWYVGVKGGVPLGVSTFSSVLTGTDKASLGYNTGIFGGYNINRIFSAELSVSFGKMGLNSPDYYGNNWLGSNGLSYLAPVAGGQGHYYRDLYSSVAVQQYGLQANISLIPAFDHLFGSNTNTRFSFILSPAIYGVGTQSTLKTIANDKQFIKDNGFGFGVGGEVSVGYRITNNLTVALSSGINQVVGSRIDGIPEGGKIPTIAKNGSSSNFIINNSISLKWRFGKKKRSTPPVAVSAPVQYKKEEPKPVVQPKPKPVEKPIVKVVIKEITFPFIYFAFNTTSIAPSELKAVSEILEILKSNPEVEIIITGYADHKGSEAVNKRYSLRRAESIKTLLVNNGIDASRIDAIGAGVDKTAPTDADARKAISIKIKNQ